MAQKRTIRPVHPCEKFAGIEYMGAGAGSRDCKEAIMRLLQFGDHISRARILSCFDRAAGEHCLLLTYNADDLIAIKSGFTSGYGGAGPHAFSYVLCLLDAHGAEIEEYEVSADILAKIDASALTIRDIAKIDKLQRVQPRRWDDYIFERDSDWKDEGKLWLREFEPILPLAIIDPRLFDLAVSFRESPDDKLLAGYRRLEDIVRKRTGVEDYGANLFSAAFLATPPKLRWAGCTSAEQKGKGQLFAATYMAYRNPRAHHELGHDTHKSVVEFLLLNKLFSLEGEAIDGTEMGDKDGV